MIDSIINDIKSAFRYGNMVMRLIIINLAVFMVTALIQAFAPGFYHGTMIHWIAVPGQFLEFITRPWTLFTSIFVHAGIWHVAWNMILLYWFGRIVGNLIGDRHILPIFLLGGVVGNLVYILSYHFFPGTIGTYAVGASAGIMAIIIVAALISPNHEMRLLLLGDIKIKYIVLAIVFFDLLGIGKGSNTGGHIAHLGGLAMGWLYMSNLNEGRDFSKSFQKILDLLVKNNRKNTPRKSPLTVKKSPKKIFEDASTNEVDAVLEKIKREGIESLSDIEKEILYQASKK